MPKDLSGVRTGDHGRSETCQVRAMDDLAPTYSNPIGVVAWSRGFSRIGSPKGSTPFHNLCRIAIRCGDRGAKFFHLPGPQDRRSETCQVRATDDLAPTQLLPRART